MLRIYSLRSNGNQRAVQVEIFDKYMPRPDEKSHPVYDMNPCIVLVAQLSDFNNHVIQLNAGCKPSVLPDHLAREISDFMGFVQDPHMENTISHQLERYGSLFEPQDDPSSGED